MIQSSVNKVRLKSANREKLSDFGDILTKKRDCREAGVETFGVRGFGGIGDAHYHEKV